MLLALVFLGIGASAQNLHWTIHSPLTDAELFSGSSMKKIVVDSHGNVYGAGTFYEAIFDDDTIRNDISKIDQDIFIAKINPNGTWAWVKILGGKEGHDDMWDLLVDHEDNIIFFADFHPSAIVDGVAMQHFNICKLDAEGNLLWHTEPVINPYSTHNVSRMAVDSDNNIVYATKFYPNNIDRDTAAIKLTRHDGSNGEILQSRFIPADQDGAMAIQDLTIDPDDNIFLGGEFGGESRIDTAVFSTSAHARSFVIVKFSKNFDFQWVNAARTESDADLHRITVDPAGNTYATGWLPVGTVIDGNVFNDSSVYIFIAKYSPEGQLLWLNEIMKMPAISNFSHIKSLDVDIEGNLYLMASILGSFSYQGHTITMPDNMLGFYIMKLSPEGSLRSIFTSRPGVSNSMGGSDFSIEVDASGNIHTGGSFYEQLAVSCDTMSSNASSYFITKHDQANWEDITFTIEAPDPICENTPTLIQATKVPGATQYVWSLPEGVSPVNGSNITNIPELEVSGTAGARGYISMIREVSCQSNYGYSIPIAVKPFPSQPVFSNGDLEICKGSTGNIYQVETDLDVVSYDWIFPQNVSTIVNERSDSAAVSFDDTFTAGQITIIASTECGSDTTSLDITATPPLGIPIIEGSAGLCVGSEATYEATVDHADQYHWMIPATFYPSGMITTIDNAINLKVISEGDSSISVYGSDQCVDQGPVTTMKARTDKSLPDPELVKGTCDRELTTNAQGNFEWYRDDVVLPDTAHQITVYDSGVYYVLDHNYCGIRQSQRTAVFPLYLDRVFVPNVVTPNGDAINERFTLDPALKNADVVIYNRTGNSIFTKKMYLSEWPRQQDDAGIYYYSIRHHCLNEPIKGWIQLFK